MCTCSWHTAMRAPPMKVAQKYELSGSEGWRCNDTVETESWSTDSPNISIINSFTRLRRATRRGNCVRAARRERGPPSAGYIQGEAGRSRYQKPHVGRDAGLAVERNEFVRRDQVSPHPRDDRPIGAQKRQSHCRLVVLGWAVGGDMPVAHADLRRGSCGRGEPAWVEPLTQSGRREPRPRLADGSSRFGGRRRARRSQ